MDKIEVHKVVTGAFLRIVIPLIPVWALVLIDSQWASPRGYRVILERGNLMMWAIISMIVSFSTYYSASEKKRKSVFVTESIGVMVVWSSLTGAILGCLFYSLIIWGQIHETKTFSTDAVNEINLVAGGIGFIAAGIAVCMEAIPETGNADKV